MINVCCIVGNLTRDPDYKVVGEDTEIANFSIAYNKSKKVGDEWKQEPHYFDCTAFGYNARFVRDYCKKGSRVFIKGELRQERWEKDGQNKSKVSITVERIVANKNGNAPDTEQHTGDIPF